jgi:hypothetical protein
MNDEFMSFEKARKELGLKEDELKRLVSDGEIRGFRDKGQTVFRKEDIRSLKDALAQQPVIVPTGGEEEGPAEVVETEGGEGEFAETVLNIEGLGDIDLGADITGPAVEAKPPEEETFATIEEETAPLEATRHPTPEKGMRDTIKMPEAAAEEEEETFVLSESDLGKETESLELLDETAAAMGAPPRAKAAPTREAAAAPEAPFAAVYPEVTAADKVTVTLLVITVCTMAIGLFASVGFLLQQGNVILDMIAGGK